MLKILRHMKTQKIYLLSCAAIGFFFLSFQSRFFEIAKQIEIYNTLYKTLNINYIDEINPGELTNKAINNTLENLDPYTRFYNEQQVEDALIRREGEYGGIGISSYYTKKGIVVADIKQGYPADKIGLKAGDIIVKINGQSIIGLDNEALSQMLKGSPNTTVNIVVEREGNTLPFSMTFDKIIDDPVPFYQMVTEDTGYIVLTQFTSYKATESVEKAFKSLKEKGMQKLVFDLRNNPGGSLFDAINITNLFIPMGKKVVDTRGKSKENSRSYSTNRSPLDLNIPIVILINGRSASASEIVSGALQDYDRAVIMGARSFGKGLVQRYYDVHYGTQMKVTISKYYTPSGRCIQELDYANRDPKTGNVPKFSERIVNSFKTEKGRTVYDGGGVMPDIALDYSKKTEETKALLKSKAIFYYATTYSRTHPPIDLETFSFSHKEFQDFERYLKEVDTCFRTKQEALFSKAYQFKNSASISKDYFALRSTLKTDKVANIRPNKDHIIPKIEDAIISQRFYKKGVYEYLLRTDDGIKKAVELLSNEKQYKTILNQ